MKLGIKVVAVLNKKIFVENSKYLPQRVSGSISVVLNTKFCDLFTKPDLDLNLQPHECGGS